MPKKVFSRNFKKKMKNRFFLFWSFFRAWGLQNRVQETKKFKFWSISNREFNVGTCSSKFKFLQLISYNYDVLFMHIVVFCFFFDWLTCKWRANGVQMSCKLRASGVRVVRKWRASGVQLACKRRARDVHPAGNGPFGSPWSPWGPWAQASGDPWTLGEPWASGDPWASWLWLD